MPKQVNSNDAKNLGAAEPPHEEVQQPLGGASENNCEEQIAQLKAQLLRARADYQNLERRQQQLSALLIAAANKDLISTLLVPLDHLELAVQQINDPGLNMVKDQFFNSLREYGLVKLDSLGKEYDHETMEVVETDGDSLVVIKVLSPGYKLNGHVLRHAKVVLGSKKTNNIDTKATQKEE